MAYDDAQTAAKHTPAWLTNNYTDNGENIDGFSLWEKKWPAGTVKLGGCHGDIAYGMYFVVVRPLDSSIVVKTDSNLTETLNEGLTAYPNPFNPEIHVRVQCRSGQDAVTVNIYNPAGRKVGTLSPVNKTYRGQGMRLEYIWNAKNQASGVYVMSVKALGKTWQKRILLVR